MANIYSVAIIGAGKIASEFDSISDNFYLTHCHGILDNDHLDPIGIFDIDNEKVLEVVEKPEKVSDEDEKLEKLPDADDEPEKVVPDADDEPEKVVADADDDQKVAADLDGGDE